LHYERHIDPEGEDSLARLLRRIPKGVSIIELEPATGYFNRHLRKVLSCTVDWLDRLRRCASSRPKIGTVTPFSNNATICSYPDVCRENGLPDGVELGELDRVFRRVNAGKIAEIPTAVGFCMYIKRACLDQVGLFDAERFGKGYGQENDFSLRAAEKGWSNVLCADTFVFHQGRASFQSEKTALQSRTGEVFAGTSSGVRGNGAPLCHP
jgi:hypothetical protein